MAGKPDVKVVTTGFAWDVRHQIEKWTAKGYRLLSHTSVKRGIRMSGVEHTLTFIKD